MLRILSQTSFNLNKFNSLRTFISESVIKFKNPKAKTCRPFSNQATRNVDVNTSVSKDVILFKYENPTFYRNLNIFACCQFLFWNYLSHFAFTTLKDAPVERNTDENQPMWRRINLGDNKYRNSITTICFLIGKLL
jgi:hypothetical protein